MDPMTIGLLGGAGLGLAKSELVDKPQAAKARHIAAVTAQYSPWTGMQAQPIQEANPFGSAMQGGSAGAMMGQSYGQNDMYKQMLEQQKNKMPGSAWGQMNAE